MKLFNFRRKIPQIIRMRAQNVADITGCYVAFNKDGTCWIYPCKPKLFKSTGTWEPAGRVDLFQCEEIKFTIKKYKFEDWQTLFSPREGHIVQMSTKTYSPTRDLSGVYV